MSKQSKAQVRDDKRLMKLITELQQKIAIQQTLDQTTVDLSEDNIIADKILETKYLFVYNEARLRNTKYSGITSAITQ